SAAIAFLQQGCGLGKASNHVVVVLAHLVVVSHLKEEVFAITLAEVLLQEVVDRSLCVVVFAMLGERADEIDDSAVPGVTVFTFRVYVLECFNCISPIEAVHPRFTDENVCVVDPFAVWMALNRYGGHFYPFFNVRLVGLGQGRVEGGEKPENAAVVIYMGGADGVFDLLDLDVGVEIAVVVRCEVVIGLTGPGVALGGAARQQDKNEHWNKKYDLFQVASGFKVCSARRPGLGKVRHRLTNAKNLHNISILGWNT